MEVAQQRHMGGISMAIEHGRAGKSTRDLEVKRNINGLKVFLIGIAVTVVFCWAVTKFIVPHSKSVVAAFGALVLVVILKTALDIIESEARKIKKLEGRASRGAKAEEEIRDILSGLSDDYIIFHDIRSPYGNIDHVVFDRVNNRIFLLETKSHKGRIRFDGWKLSREGRPFEKDFIKQVSENAKWLKETLEKETSTKVYVNPVIVFTNAYIENIGNAEKGFVKVVNKRDLIRIITGGMKNTKPPDLDTSQAIYRALLQLVSS
ncbi:MAG: nuclease-related domain-containing protein [Armatimonadota bacterium]